MTIIRAKAVIGAGYGDEGKGLVTDVLAAATLERRRGAQQWRGAGRPHGGRRPWAIRHVFHHVGSGALAGAATHFSRALRRPSDDAAR